MNWIKTWLYIGIICLILSIVFSWVAYSDLINNYEENFSKCYDYYGNEIVGLECIEDKDSYLYFPIFNTILCLMAIVFLIQIITIFDIF